MLSPLENQIKQKIERLGIPLKDWDVRINYGIKTGYNEAFIINADKRLELIEKCPEADSIIRPILLGKNIKRYNYEWQGLWIIFTRRGIQIDDYPSVKEHLLKYYDQLKPRNNGELTGRKPGSYEWFHIQDNVAYYQDFEKPKIVWGNLALRSQFSFVKENYYINAPSAFIATQNYYLLAVLNSKIADYYIKQLGVSRNGGYFEYKPMFVQQLPIPNVTENEQKKFQLIIEKLLHERAENRNTADLEIRIDEMIYELYELSNDETAFLNSI